MHDPTLDPPSIMKPISCFGLQVLLVIWLGGQWGHRWAVNLCREQQCGPAQGDASGTSRWFVPAVEWSNDVLLAPGGKGMFPCGIGRLRFAVWCVLMARLASGPVVSSFVEVLRLMNSGGWCRPCFLRHARMQSRYCLHQSCVHCQRHRVLAWCFIAVL